MLYYGVEIIRYDFVYEPINDLNCCCMEMQIIEKNSPKKPKNKKNAENVDGKIFVGLTHKQMRSSTLRSTAYRKKATKKVAFFLCPAPPTSGPRVGT